MIKKKLFIIFMVIFLTQYLIPQYVFAQSNYVLPYPSFMPGNPFYGLHRKWETVIKYWYFGNFSQFVYNLKLSDKYLVEAKTLFEYKQYLLAYEAIERSNSYFVPAYQFLEKAKKEGKNISQKTKVLQEAGLKHKEVLEQIQKNVPEQFVWAPENDRPQRLFLWKKISEGIAIRNRFL